MYWPALQLVMLAHTRSASALGAAAWYSPAPHTRTAAHACAVSLVALNVALATHGTHTRSDVGVGAADWPTPTPHSAVPLHARSDEGVAGTASNCEAVQMIMR